VDKNAKKIAALIKYQMVYNAFDVLMPRSERDGKCILPDVEFWNCGGKRMIIYFLVIIDIGTHCCSSLRWA